MIFTVDANSVHIQPQRGHPQITVEINCDLEDLVSSIQRQCAAEEIAETFGMLLPGDVPVRAGINAVEFTV